MRLIERVCRGEPVLAFETVRRAKDGRLLPVALTMSPTLDEDARVVAVSTVERDVTRQRQAEERLRLLLAELGHRVKNTLAVVQSIAQQSLSGERSLAAAREAFASRIRALAKTHDLLTASGWRGVSLQALIEAELKPYGRRAALCGENLVLDPKAAQVLALVLHELATNAAKYGALSCPSGQVTVGWTVAEGGEGCGFCLTWRERGGPPVAPPTQRGFGRMLLERAIAHELGGKTRLDFAPEGLTYELEAPLAHLRAD